MTVGGSIRAKPPGKRAKKWRVLFHALVVVALLGAHVWTSFERGPRDGPDARWYIDYALSVFHESQFPAGRAEIVPLHPLWLNLWMNVDPDYVDDLHCLRDNIPYWVGRKYFDDGDLTTCRYLDNTGFRIMVLLGGIGTGLVWIAGWLASGRPMVAHLAAMFVVYTQGFVIYGNAHQPESLVVPLLAGANVCLAWLVLGTLETRGSPRLGTGRTKWRTVAVATTCGLLLGALALSRPPYEFLLAALPPAAAIWMFRDRPRRREIAIATACIVVTASLVVTPWIARNYTQKDFVGFTQDYGPIILIQRLAFNAMTWREWIASFPVWSGGTERRLATELFGAETVARLTRGNPDYYGYPARVHEIMNVENVAPEDRLELDFLLGRMYADLPKHLAVSVPLAWRGMMQHRGIPFESTATAFGDGPMQSEGLLAQHRGIPFGSAAWLLAIFSFVRGSSRNRGVLAALAFCPFVVLAINALVSHSIPRYSFGLLTPLSVGAALPVAWAIDGAWNSLRRRIPWTMPHAPNPSTDSHGRP